MPEEPMEERGREIAEAARRYAATRRRFGRLELVRFLLVMVGSACAVLALSVARTGQPGLKAWQRPLLLAAIVCFAATLWSSTSPSRRLERGSPSRRPSTGSAVRR